MTAENERMEIAWPEAQSAELSKEQLNVVAAVVTNVIAPVFQSLADMVNQNAQALERFAALQAQQNARMEQLERQMRLNTPVTSQQVRYINNAIREKATTLLNDKNVSDPAATKKLANVIRKALLVHYGVSATNELPKCEYSVVMDWVDRWFAPAKIRAIAQEVQERV